jgi:hypothetical protein
MEDGLNKDCVGKTGRDTDLNSRPDFMVSVENGWDLWFSQVEWRHHAGTPQSVKWDYDFESILKKILKPYCDCIGTGCYESEFKFQLEVF